MVCDTPFYVLPKAGTEKVPVPCGRCPPCKLRRVNSWVFRLLEEDKVSSSAYFVTFTYDTTHVPISENGFMTLRKRDFQLFMKRLRKLCSDKLKYYAVGEYGSNNHRPHYHAIIFNAPDPEIFATAWTAGQIFVGNVSGDSIAYTMKYIDKQKGKRLHARDDREPEFPLMSKGLGASYLTDAAIKYHKADISRLYVTREGGHKSALPRYYREKIYSQREKEAQVEHIQQVVAEKDRLDRIKFDSLRFPAHFKYEDWKIDLIYGRYKHFYALQKKRNL